MSAAISKSAAATAQNQELHESQARTQRAAALITERLPELVAGGRVDDWAVWALLELWAESGEGNVTAGQVRARFRVKQDELIARLGWNPWTQEGPDDQQ